MSDAGKAALEGRCTCGKVRYRLNAAPIVVHCCHCSWCQRETGSAFAVNAVIEAAQVELLLGRPVKVTLLSLSGKGQVLWRCPDCGVTLWSNYAGAGPNIHFVRVGTLDEPARLAPAIHIYTSTKQPWVILPADIPAVPEFYSPADIWPAESVKRFQVARSG